MIECFVDNTNQLDISSEELIDLNAIPAIIVLRITATIRLGPKRGQQHPFAGYLTPNCFFAALWVTLKKKTEKRVADKSFKFK